VKVIVSPTFGLELLTALVNTRSATCGVTVALAVLLPVTGSNWSAAETVDVLVAAAWPVTVALRTRVALAPTARVPTAHTPVAAVYVPRLGVADTKLRPAGRRSWTETPVAVFGPMFVRVTVNVTTSPT